MPLATKRLTLRPLTVDDAAFILGLLNEPSFLDFIGDRGVRTLSDAERYIRENMMESYARLGFGLYLTALNEGDIPIGICGLLKREALPDPDIGFAFLPAYWGQGYGVESARAVLDHAERDFALARVAAITSPANVASKALLAKLGFRFEGMTRLAPEKGDVELHGYAVAARHDDA